MTREGIREVDRSGMYEAVRRFPAQWRQGRQQALQADLDGVPRGAYRQVMVAGMGGSAMGGDLLRTLALGQAAIPVHVTRAYQLPAWVDSQTVVIASSYSGNTEETLAAFDEALRRGASVLCITTGGALLDRALEQEVPYVEIPGGLQPRAAIGYSLTALLTVAERLQLLTIPQADWEETQVLLEQQAEALGDPERSPNPAFELAQSLVDHVPCVFSSAGLIESVNLRWRTQLHENAKTLSLGNVFPELNHNEIMGWERRTGWLGRVGVIVLRDRGDEARIQRRIDVTRALLAERAGGWTEVHSRGTSRLARMMTLLYLGDWVSLYLALLLHVDPTPIPLISQLKAALAAGDEPE